MSRRFAIALLLLAACKDDIDLQPDAPVVDPTHDGGMAGPRAVVVSGNDTAGIMSALDVATLTVRQNVSPAGGVGSDPLIRRFGASLYVVNRYSLNSVSVYDARTLVFQEQYGSGTGTNAQDVAIVGDFLYVPTAGNAGLVKINLETGVRMVVDLATPLGDPDGNPDCVSAYAVGTRVFVACGMFDESFSPRSNGKVAIIDTANGDAVTSVTLPFTNPQSLIVRSPEDSVFGGDLLIATTPSYTDYSTGCIARVSTGASPAATCAAGLTNTDVGGIIARMDVGHDGVLLWLAVTTIDSSFMNPTGTLRAFDLEAGTLWPPTSPTTELIVDAAGCPDGSIVTLDRKQNMAGIRVFKSSAEVTTAPLPFGLPPLFGNNTVCYDPSAL